MFYSILKKISLTKTRKLDLMNFLVEVRRIELLTPCLQSRCSPS